MAEIKFTVGDVVRFKSGSPALVVVETPDTGTQVRVIWMQYGTNDIKEAWVASAALVPASANTAQERI